MKKVVIFLIMLSTVINCSTEKKISFQEFVSSIENYPVSKRKEIADISFKNFSKGRNFPIIEEDEVTFVYKGQGKQVYLRGDFTLNFDLFIPMKNIEGTDIFYNKLKLFDDSNVEYKYFIDGQYMADKLNPDISKTGFGNSLMSMAKYEKIPEIELNKNIPHGTLVEEIFKGTNLTNDKENERSIWVYLPHGYSPDKKYKVIYFTDGNSYIKEGNAVNVLDNMIAKNEIEPVIAIFVNCVERNAEFIYSTKDRYIEYFINTIMKNIEEKYLISQKSDDRILVGDSWGADFAVYLSYEHPEKFGNVLAQSGSYLTLYGSEQYIQGNSFKYQGKKNVIDELVKGSAYPVKMYLVYGNYERLAKDSKMLYNILKKNNTLKGLEISSYSQGHGFNLWGSTLREGLLWLIKGIEKKSTKSDIEKFVNVNTYICSWKNEKLKNFRNEKYYLAIGKRSNEMFEYESSEEIIQDILRSDKYIEIKPEEDTNITFSIENKEYDKYFIMPFYDINENGKIDYEEIELSGIDKKLIENWQYEKINDWMGCRDGSTLFLNKDKYIFFSDTNILEKEKNPFLFLISGH